MSEPTSTPAKHMSSRDKAILDMVMNSNEWIESDVNEAAQKDLSGFQGKTFSAERLVELQGFEKEGVKAAEVDDLEGAVTFFNKAISLEPTYASAHNNIAQVLRMQGKTDDALSHLSLAIEHGVGDASVLRQAYTQRAIIRKSLGQEEGSASDFEMGAKYGQSLAKAAAKAENPYAKLCHAMVMEAMKNDGCL